MPIKAFGGKGQMLGRCVLLRPSYFLILIRQFCLKLPENWFFFSSPVPNTLVSTSLGGDLAPQECAQNEELASRALGVEPNQPTTNVQIRLADGTRSED